jgi:hypothetical protein
LCAISCFARHFICLSQSVCRISCKYLSLSLSLSLVLSAPAPPRLIFLTILFVFFVDRLRRRTFFSLLYSSNPFACPCAAFVSQPNLLHSTSKRSFLRALRCSHSSLTLVLITASFCVRWLVVRPSGQSHTMRTMQPCSSSRLIFFFFFFFFLFDCCCSCPRSSASRPHEQNTNSPTVQHTPHLHLLPFGPSPTRVFCLSVVYFSLSLHTDLPHLRPPFLFAHARLSSAGLSTIITVTRSIVTASAYTWSTTFVRQMHSFACNAGRSVGTLKERGSVDQVQPIALAHILHSLICRCSSGHEQHAHAR